MAFSVLLFDIVQRHPGILAAILALCSHLASQADPPRLPAGTDLGRADVSHYCNEGEHGCRRCCGRWARLNKTISGRPPQAGVTVAAPPAIPLGTWVHIEGVGIRRVDDRTDPRYAHRWDVFVGRHKGAHQEALVLGLKRNRRIVVISNPYERNTYR